MFFLDGISDVQFPYIALGLLFAILILYLLAKKWRFWRNVFVGLSLVLGLIYLIWRIGFTLPLSFGVVSIIFGVLLVLAEVMGYSQALVNRLLFINPQKPERHTAEEWDTLPTVDVLIATYNESTSILTKTIVGCLNLDYPKDKITITLCDDGARETAKALCAELGIQYIARPEKSHAKAGNINYALQNTNGRFVALLDADMVPKSAFLQKTIGYFVDDTVGFVQTPQIFSNPDPFQHNLHLNAQIPNEQDLFMREIQAGRARYNAVLHVGTNAVFRRKVLDEIGGIPVGTITEDMATGMLIQARGYQTIFIKEVLCTGLSVETFTDLIRQRERWCRGNIQVVKKWNPLTVKGLTPIQRLIYFDGFIYWFFGAQKMVYLLCPLVYLIFGTVIISTSLQAFTLFWLPSFLVSFLAARLLMRQSRAATWSHIYDVAMAPYLSVAALMEAVFSRPIPFRVTPKGIHENKTRFSLATALPFIIILGLTLYSWVLIPQHISGNTFSMESVLINMVWTLYNSAAVCISILVCIERPRKRTLERVHMESAVAVNGQIGRVCKISDISETGAKIECEQPDDMDKDETLTLDSQETGKIQGQVAWKKNVGRRSVFGVKFSNYNLETYKKLIKLITDRNQGYYKNDDE